jgi:hypothetical protein
MCGESVRMADQEFANQPAGNNRVGFRDVPLVEAAEGEFAQLMALFATWRADIDAEPFAYSDEDLLRHWKRPPCVRFDLRSPPPFAAGEPGPGNPHRT